MNKGFWDKLEKPIMVLAPMANVTDAAFRFLIAKYGRPDVMFTEFVSIDGLCSEGKEKLLVDFWYSESERPIVAQIFGAKPENFFKVAKLIKDLKFDGIDINMGCPDRAVLKQGAGGALIKNPKLAQEIIQACHEGAPDLPVSVKTRIGISKNQIETWIPELLKMDLAAIIVHLRTVKELSLAPAHWELMPEIVKLVRTYNRHMHILGNGDVQTLKEAEQKVAETGCDGVMIGRGIFGNPWMFSSSPGTGEVRRGRTQESTTPSPSYSRRGIYTPTIAEKLAVMIEHTKLFEQMFCGISAKGGSGFAGKDFQIMRKHYKAYVNGFDGAKELRMQLMEADSAEQVEKIVREFVNSLAPIPEVRVR